MPSRMISSALTKEKVVHTLTDKGVIHIRNRHDPRLQGDLLSFQPLRVAGAVHALMVIVGYVLGNAAEVLILCVEKNLMYDAGSLHRVGFHL